MGFIGSNYILNRMEKYDDFIYNMDSLTYASNPWYLERTAGELDGSSPVALTYT